MTTYKQTSRAARGSCSFLYVMEEKGTGAMTGGRGAVADNEGGDRREVLWSMVKSTLRLSIFTASAEFTQLTFRKASGHGRLLVYGTISPETGGSTGQETARERRPAEDSTAPAQTPPARRCDSIKNKNIYLNIY